MTDQQETIDRALGVLPMTEDEREELARVNDIIGILENTGIGISHAVDIMIALKEGGYKIVDDNDARPTVKSRDLAKELYSMYRTPIVVAQHGTGEVYVRAFGV